MSEEKARLLLLVNVDDDANLFDGLGARMDSIQHMDQASISGRSYYRLQCIIIQSNRDDLVYGAQKKMYSEAWFKQDSKSCNGGFRIKFDGCDKTTTFNWLDVVDYPSAFMFFGTPCTKTRVFNTIFHGFKSPNALFRR